MSLCIFLGVPIIQEAYSFAYHAKQLIHLQDALISNSNFKHDALLSLLGFKSVWTNTHRMHFTCYYMHKTTDVNTMLRHMQMEEYWANKEEFVFIMIYGKNGHTPQVTS